VLNLASIANIFQSVGAVAAKPPTSGLDRLRVFALPAVIRHPLKRVWLAKGHLGVEDFVAITGHVMRASLELRAQRVCCAFTLVWIGTAAGV
jgi:hypothetical protein